MANTREELAKIGAQNSEALVQAGVRTVRDAIRDALKAKGISEAVGFELTLKNGENITILSEDNPNMDRPASEVQSVAVKQSARAGYEPLF